MKALKTSIALSFFFIINLNVFAQENEHYIAYKNGFKIELKEKHGNHFWMISNSNKESKLKNELDLIWASKGNNRLNIQSLSDGLNNPLIIYNGKEISKEQFDEIDRNNLKNLNINFTKGEKAKDKYGHKAKNGVMIITSNYNTFKL